MPLCDFYEICSICSLFHDALAVKIWMDSLKGSRSYEGFKLRESGSPKFLVPSSCETIHEAPKSFKVQEHAQGPLSPC